MGDGIKSVAAALPTVAAPFAGGGPFGSIVGGLLGGQSGAAGQVTPVNPMVAQVQQAQLKQANDFNSNIGNYEKDQINSATDASRLKTAQDQNAGTASSNARGMLYGGHNEAQNASIASGNAGALNNQIANINYNAQNTGQQLNNQAANSGLVLQNANQQYNNQAYNAAMNQQQANAQGLNGLIGGVGSLIAM